MKVLYISTPPFFDMDLSLIKHLSKKCDVYYLLELAPHSLKSTALNIEKQPTDCSVLTASLYPELERHYQFIPKDKFLIINRTKRKSYAWSNVLMQKKIKNFIEHINPDMIHCSSFLFINYFNILLKYKNKMVLTVHDPFPHVGESSLRKNTIRILNYLFVKNIVLLNTNQHAAFISKTKKYKFKNVHISSLGIYEYLKDYKVKVNESEKTSLLFFGRISPYKGIDVLLEAFGLLKTKYQHLELIIAGKGNYYFDVTPYMQDPQIKFLNRYIPNEELVELISNSALVVCPYIEATQSGVVMSAFALNKPVLVTNVGGLPEMVDHGKTGIIVDPNNPIAISDALNSLMESADILEKMKRNIENEYNFGKKSWEYITDELFDFYKKILNKHGE